MRQLHLQTTELHLRIREYLSNIIDRPARDACNFQRRNPLSRGFEHGGLPD
jgi:hypothetical protein